MTFYKSCDLLFVMNDELNELDAIELSVVFAQEIAGWHAAQVGDAESNSDWIMWHDEGGSMVLPPRFAESADLIFPFLYREYWEADAHYNNNLLWFGKKLIVVKVNADYYGEANNFPQAAAIALIRRHRAEVKAKNNS